MSDLYESFSREGNRRRAQGIKKRSAFYSIDGTAALRRLQAQRVQRRWAVERMARCRQVMISFAFY